MVPLISIKFPVVKIVPETLGRVRTFSPVGSLICMIVFRLELLSIDGPLLFPLKINASLPLICPLIVIVSYSVSPKMAFPLTVKSFLIRILVAVPLISIKFPVVITVPETSGNRIKFEPVGLFAPIRSFLV